MEPERILLRQNLFEQNGLVSELPLQNLFSIKFLKQNKIFPLRQVNNSLSVAMANPHDYHTIEMLHVASNFDIKAFPADEEEILSAIQYYYETSSTTMEKIIEDISSEDAELMFSEDEDVDHLREVAQEAPVVKLVNLIISRAIEVGASDIHIEPFEGKLKIRYRIDGILHDAESPPKRLQSAVVSRIKIMAKLNIAERRLPQDGRIKLKVLNKSIDLRVSTIPTLYGESVVMRILDRSTVFLSLDKLGFPEKPLRQFENLIQKPYGIILVTGPTGSGKTTTLYASLDKINSPDKKIITIEDPVEYQLTGVNQIQVKPKIGLNFANGLRHIVRQDPDIIMVGEIRDSETAEIAIQSALTGHMVFSTLHTNDAAGAITRLLDMGVENYLVASAVLGILAQRLIRILCMHCREQFIPDEKILNEIGLIKETQNFSIFRAKGCEECSYTGYRGRTGIYELLIIDDEIRQLILQKASAHVIKQKAISLGMRTLREDGWDKVKKGASSVSEVIRVTQEDDGSSIHNYQETLA